MTVKEVSQITGISVRTLHHYDKIGLLCPRRNEKNGYREYGCRELDLLQQIQLLGACGCSLAAIQKILSDPHYRRAESLSLQKKYLEHEKCRINTMLQTLNKTMLALKGEIEMSEKEKFEGFASNQNPYETEARRLWGDEAVDSSGKKLSAMTQTEKNTVEDGMHTIFSALSELRRENPASPAAQQGIRKLYDFFTKTLGIHYTAEVFAGVGMLYVQDRRFTKNIDRFGEGLAVFLSQAIQIFAKTME